MIPSTLKLIGVERRGGSASPAESVRLERKSTVSKGSLFQRI